MSGVSYGSYEQCTPTAGFNAPGSDLQEHWMFPYLYVSHGLSAFKDRLWQFAVPILLMEIWTDTMLPPAIAAFTCNIIAFVGMPYVGQWVDQNDRLRSLRVSIFGEAALIVLSGVFLFLLSWNQGVEVAVPEWTYLRILLFGAVCVTNGFVEIAMRIGQQSLEKDWSLVIAEHQGRDITSVNQTLRVIDLSNKLLGPASFGLFIQFAPPQLIQKMFTTTVLLLLFNIMSLPIEYHCASTVYFSIPELADKRRKKARKNISHFKSLTIGWSAYARHVIFFPSVAYSMLWFTVLDNGVLMTAYLKWQGIPEGPLGISRGVGAMVGIFGTLTYGLWTRCAGTEMIGAFATWVFWAMLLPVPVYFVFIGNDFTGALVMIAAVTFSRAALWVYDQSIVKVLQDNLHESERGTLNGVHTAMCQLFLVASSVVGIIFPDPRQFKRLVLISVGSVFVSSILYTYWALTKARLGKYPKRAPHTVL